jgi:RimJ/RimL family protein N-acetyltransferase
MERPPESIVPRPGLELRRHRVEDAPAVADGVRSSLPELAPWLPWATAEAADPARQRDRLAEGVHHWDGGTDFDYVIVADRRVVGCMGLHPRVGQGGVEIGYWLRTDHTGRGIVTACAGALTAAALDLRGVERVEIHCDEANERSAAVARRLGYRLDRVEEAPVVGAAESGRNQVWVYPPGDGSERGGERAR